MSKHSQIREYKTDEKTRARCLANYHKTKGQPTKGQMDAQRRRELRKLTRSERRAATMAALERRNVTANVVSGSGRN